MSSPGPELDLEPFEDEAALLGDDVDPEMEEDGEELFGDNMEALVTLFIAVLSAFSDLIK